ncbi:hypothetical protein EJB05_48828 [Eragrostis curvula]|uniref:Uncharacterized protein n=1 Tax=Eragrostis curvula TaxID=38414 RepID=A0A5J9T355_9POAL|nr:hypothetical protein EJB05_48828 [Eragrostis curvula]
MKALPKTSNQSQRRREGNDATVAASVPTNDADASGKVADSSMQSGFVLASVACREQIVEEDASQYPSLLCCCAVIIDGDAAGGGTPQRNPWSRRVVELIDGDAAGGGCELKMQSGKVKQPYLMEKSDQDNRGRVT